MRARLYHLLRRITSQEQRRQIKRSIASARKRLAPLYRVRYGTFGAEDLREELARHLPPDVEIVMVHCSLNDLQPMYTGGVKELLDALIELCRDESNAGNASVLLRGPGGGSSRVHPGAPGLRRSASAL